jgi:hypothetical protein
MSLDASTPKATPFLADGLFTYKLPFFAPVMDPSRNTKDSTPGAWDQTPLDCVMPLDSAYALKIGKETTHGIV